MVERNSGTCLDGLFFQYHGQPMRIVFGFREPSPAHLHACNGWQSEAIRGHQWKAQADW